MKIAELKDRVVLGAARAYARRTMADYAERPEESQFTVTVSRVVDLNPVMRRITLSAPELTRYELLGPDEYFGLLMPGADGRIAPARPRADQCAHRHRRHARERAAGPALVHRARAAS